MKKLLCLVLALCLLPVMTACSNKAEPAPAPTDETPADDGVPVNPEPEEEKNTEPVKNEVKEPEPVHPYEWLGLSGMPECNYLDILSSNRYYQVYDLYGTEGKTEYIEAADGIDSYQASETARSLAVDGMFYSIDEIGKTYTRIDNTDSTAQARAYMESVFAQGTNIYGRELKGTGKGAVPLYADAEGDAAEYEYYEFLTSNPGVNEIVERFYMRDGDVFAIYTRAANDVTAIESTKVIKSISPDVPAGIFTTPNLAGYTEAG